MSQNLSTIKFGPPAEGRRASTGYACNVYIRTFTPIQQIFLKLCHIFIASSGIITSISIHLHFGINLDRCTVPSRISSRRRHHIVHESLLDLLLLEHLWGDLKFGRRDLLGRNRSHPHPKRHNEEENDSSDVRKGFEALLLLAIDLFVRLAGTMSDFD